MDAARPIYSVVNQVVDMSATTKLDPRFEISYLPQWSGKVSCYLLAVPNHLGDKVAKYLKSHGCKFQQRWSERRHNRCEFFIERLGHPKLLQALVDRTLANNGKVNINQVSYEIVNRKNNSSQYLNVTFKGECIQYMCCERADDFYNHNVFNATFTENDLLDIKAAIFTAVERSQGTLAVGYDTRICLDIAELFMEYGFVSVPEDECLVLKR